MSRKAHAARPSRRRRIDPILVVPRLLPGKSVRQAARAYDYHDMSTKDETNTARVGATGDELEVKAAAGDRDAIRELRI